MSWFFHATAGKIAEAKALELFQRRLMSESDRYWLIYSKNSMLYRVIEGAEVDYKERHFFCGDKRLLASATYRNDRDGGVP